MVRRNFSRIYQRIPDHFYNIQGQLLDYTNIINFLPLNFAEDIYKYCNEIKDIKFFYFLLNKYFDTWMDSKDGPNLRSILIGKSRKEISSKFWLVYSLQEQALCYSTFLIDRLEGIKDKEKYSERLFFLWTKELAENLAKFADFTRPREDSVFKQEKEV